MASCTSRVVVAALRRAVKGPFPKLYEAVTGLLRTSVDNLLGVLDQVDVATVCPVAAALLPLCWESASDFVVTNLSFKAMSRVLSQAAEGSGTTANADLAETVGSFVQLLLARLEQATEEALQAAQDTSQAAEKRFSRVSRIIRFYLNHLSSMAKAHAAAVAATWERLLPLFASVKSLTVAVFLLHKPQAQQEVSGCLAASLTAVLGPLSSSDAVDVDMKRDWLLHLARRQPERCLAAREVCGNALLLAELLALNCWSLFRSEGSGDAMLGDVVPCLLRTVDQGTNPQHACLPNHVLFSCVGSDTSQSVYQCLRAHLCQFVVAVPPSKARTLQRQLYGALSSLGLAATLLVADLWAFAFRAASQSWQLHQLEILMRLASHVIQMHSGETIPGGVEEHGALFRALRHTLRGLPDCGAASMQVFLPRLQQSLKEADCSLLNATLQCLPNWAMHHLQTGFPQLWTAILEKSTAHCNATASSHHPDWHNLVPALDAARRCLHRVRLSVVGESRPQLEEGCAGCFGQRVPPAHGAGCPPGCACSVVRMEPHSAVEGVMQKLLTAVGNVLVRIDLTQQPAPPETPRGMEEVVGLCLEVCGALLPIMKPQVLIKLLARATTEYLDRPSLSVALDDLLCKCAFLKFGAAPDALPDSQRDSTLSLMAQLWRHQLRRDAASGPAVWLPLHHTLVAFEAFAKFTEFPYDKMVEGETKKAVVRYLTNQVLESNVPLTPSEEAWFADAAMAQARRLVEGIQMAEMAAKRPREKDRSTTDERCPKRLQVGTPCTAAPPSVATVLLDTVAEQVGRLEDHLHTDPHPHPDVLERVAALRARLGTLERHVRSQLRVAP
eukprot:GGOE01014873.1.p1 GENE.GGOE01014873.1~~GGOE01014873.1.p1  ORF type:complete len:925 (-),score=181.96 GGOE01014873.1:225-2747(-)